MDYYKNILESLRTLENVCDTLLIEKRKLQKNMHIMCTYVLHINVCIFHTYIYISYIYSYVLNVLLEGNHTQTHTPHTQTPKYLPQFISKTV